MELAGVYSSLGQKEIKHKLQPTLPRNPIATGRTPLYAGAAGLAPTCFSCGETVANRLGVCALFALLLFTSVWYSHRFIHSSTQLSFHVG